MMFLSEDKVIPVAVHVQGLCPEDIETTVLTVIALGWISALNEEELVVALSSTLAAADVTEWAEDVACRNGLTWKRQQPLGEILFAKMR